MGSGMVREGGRLGGGVLMSGGLCSAGAIICYVMPPGSIIFVLGIHALPL